MGDQENRTLGDHGNERNNRSDNKQSIKQYSKTRLCPARRRIDQIELYLVWIYWKTPEIPKRPPVCSSKSGRIARFHNLPDRPVSTPSHHAMERSRALLTKNARLCSSPRVHARPPPCFLSVLCRGDDTPGLSRCSGTGGCPGSLLTPSSVSCSSLLIGHMHNAR